MKKIKLVIIIIIILLLIIIISAIILGIKNYQQKKIDYDYNLIFFRNLSDEELADYYYNNDNESDFVKKDLVNDLGDLGIQNSVADSEEAVQYLKLRNLGENVEKIDPELVHENKYLYIVYEEYIDYRKTGNITFENNYIFFKEEILDVENNLINVEKLDSAEIKDVLDLYMHLENADNVGTQLAGSKIEENSSEYVYLLIGLNGIRRGLWIK